MPSSLDIATSSAVIRRGLMYALVVGSLLIAINHGDALLRGQVDAVRLLKMALTVVVPYLVSTLSSISALRQMARGSQAVDGTNATDATCREAMGNTHSAKTLDTD